jgi:uncharacterized membrane protein HdeD (DUF308 family)
MITLPNWFPWYFLIVGVVLLLVNLFVRRSRFKALYLIFGILGIAIAILLWLDHANFTLR